jgi:hypothetical protein
MKPKFILGELHMITKKGREEVIAIGARNRASYLLEQYGYTMGVAKLDGEALEAIMPKGYQAEVAESADKVSEAQKNKTLAAEESRGSTQNVTKIMRQAKEWRKTAVIRGKFAVRSGYDIPKVLTRLDNLSGVPAVAENMNDMVKMLEANKAGMDNSDFQAFVDEGKTLVEQIRAFDSVQEVKRLKSLPDSVRSFYYEKGLLYIGIKGINDWGRALHRGNPAGANAYSLSILYRRAGKRKPAEETTNKK